MATHDQNDGNLLADFLAAGGEAPFETLIQRHGRMVFNVCHRVLGQTQDAEDAAQAVFLTLAQKARTLTHRESLAGWLHHVAWHVAQRARESTSLQRHREREAGEMKDKLQQGGATTARQWQELAPLLDEELDALPEKYRLPLILHHIEGHTKDETARMLATSSGTVSTWLDRGREKLKDRLARRGVVLSAGLIATLARQNASAAEASAAFAASTAKAATLVTFGNAAATGAVSAQVAALTEGMMKAMMLAKLKAAAAIVAAVMLVGGGAGVITYNALAEDPPVTVAAGSAPTVASAKEIVAKVIKVKHLDDNLNWFGEMVTIDKGTRDGVHHALELDVFRDGKRISTISDFNEIGDASVSRGQWRHPNATRVKVGDIVKGALTGAPQVVDGLSLYLGRFRELIQKEDGTIEPVDLHFSFSNSGKTPLKLDHYLLGFRNLKVVVEGLDGANVKQTRTGKRRRWEAADEKHFPGIAAGNALSPAMGWTLPGEIGEFDYRLLKPGRYRVKLVYTNPSWGHLSEVDTKVLGAEAEKFSKDCWRGTVTSNERILEVLPATDAKAKLPGIKNLFETQTAALQYARQTDIPALAATDSAVIAMGFVEATRARATISDAETLKKIVGMLAVADTVPSAGEAEFNISFAAKGTLLNEVWVYPDGEWGIVRKGGTSWTLGRNNALPALLKQLMAEKQQAADAYTYVARVVKITGTTLTLHSFRGHSGIIRDEGTDAQTIFEPNGKPGKISDFKKDDWVKIYWTDNPKRIVKVETTKGLWEDAPATR